MKLSKKLEKKIIKAGEYIKNGDPLKDVLDDYDVILAIEFLAKQLKTRKERP